MSKKHIPVVLAGGLGASLGSIFLFLKIADEILENETMAFDTRVIEEAREMRSLPLDRAMSAITALGEPWALCTVSALVALRWRSQKRYADITTDAFALVGGGVLNQILKSLFHRDRPALKLRRAHASGYSFPSGHAMTGLATYGTLAYLAGRRGVLTGHSFTIVVGLPVAILCTFLGGSRVYLEVHYPTDVLAGWAAGTLWVTTCGIARSMLKPGAS